MVRQLPRNHKSKGLKLKHVLQACLLLGICFWLVYQINHSKDKKDSHTNVAKVSSTDSHGVDTLKLGRKGLDPRRENTSVKNEKPEEEDGMEEAARDEKGQVEGEEEEAVIKPDKSEEEEAVIKPDKSEEEEDEESVTVKSKKLDVEGEEETEIEDDSKHKEGGNDENGEIDEEKTIDDGVLHDEDIIDDENLKVNMGDNYEDGRDSDAAREASNRNTREAREEQYNGDDVSSAVLDSSQPENNNFSLDAKPLNSTLFVPSELKIAVDAANHTSSEGILKSGPSKFLKNITQDSSSDSNSKTNQTQNLNAGIQSSTVLDYSNGRNESSSGLSSSSSEPDGIIQQDDPTITSDPSIPGKESSLKGIIKGTQVEDAAAQ